MKRHRPEAVIFDLDGVITRTALVHSAAWKQMFDEYLREREARYGEPFGEFTHERDYLTYVDGKPRYQGVASFLESRGIELDWGDPSDGLDRETVCGIGNRKNRAFNQILERDGAEVFDSSVALIKELRAAGVRVGVASSSKNCRTVLRVTGLLPLVETVVDGLVSAERGLKGKPDPDIFTTAADELGVPYDAAVVVEDAVSGVRAGRAGNFGLVLGVAREGNEGALLAGGADLVVTDLGEIDLDGLRDWFEAGLELDNRTLRYYGADPARERHRETLLTVGNGYLGTRGAFEESSAGETHYPATYIAGVTNRATSLVGDREVENEDIVNCVNWLPITFRLDGGPWFDPDTWEVLSLKRELDLRSGQLRRWIVARDDRGRVVEVFSSRLASMDSPHLAALSYRVTPRHGAKVTLRAALDGDLINDGVARYRSLNQRHLEPVEAGGQGAQTYLVSRTRGSGITIAAAQRLDVRLEGAGGTRAVSLGEDLTADVAAGGTLVADKIVAIHTSRETPDPVDASRRLCGRAPGFDEIARASAERWADDIWRELDIEIEGDRLAQKLIRLHLYHLMVSASPHSVGLDVSVTARGLHGEAYRGHIFWDELFILPLYAMHLPEVSREMVMYRVRRLDGARRDAAAEGLGGAMYPWQSGSDGREETQVTHLNPLSGRWDPDHSRLQRHVSLAVAYDLWQHARITGDDELLRGPGGEMLLEISRFWANKAERDESDGRYHIAGVMGPDEFHEKHPPGAGEGGLRDNTYTNLMVVWVLRAALGLLDELNAERRAELTARVGLEPEELERWRDVTRRMALVISDEGILAQFEGYFELDELDWDHYRSKYGDIHRLDRILRAEGRSPDAYQVAKQADALMVFYLLPVSEVTELVEGLGYRVPPSYVRRNLDYYLARTSHGSTLSRVVHSYLAGLLGDDELSWRLFREALTSDYADIQGGTTAEGIHTGVMAGTVLGVLRTYAGLTTESEPPALAPRLPEPWLRLGFGFRFRGSRYTVEIERDLLRAWAENGGGRDVDLRVSGTTHALSPRSWTDIEL